MYFLHSSIVQGGIVQLQQSPILVSYANGTPPTVTKETIMSATTENYRPRMSDRNSGFFGGLSQRYAQYRTYRSTLDELSGLSDRELADLGMSRSMLRSVAYKAAYPG